MPHIRRSKPLVNSMNSIARMTDVCLGLSHCESFTRKASHNSDAGAVEADVPETDAAEKLMPFFRGIFWQGNKLRAALFLREAAKRQKIRVQRRGVNATSLCHEADCSRLSIDVVHGRSGFGNSATLAHRYEPRFSHPGGLVEQ